jgi:hypothetical protein
LAELAQNPGRLVGNVVVVVDVVDVVVVVVVVVELVVLEYVVPVMT